MALIVRREQTKSRFSSGDSRLSTLLCRLTKSGCRLQFMYEKLENICWYKTLTRVKPLHPACPNVGEQAIDDIDTIVMHILGKSNEIKKTQMHK